MNFFNALFNGMTIPDRYPRNRRNNYIPGRLPILSSNQIIHYPSQTSQTSQNQNSQTSQNQNSQTSQNSTEISTFSPPFTFRQFNQTIREIRHSFLDYLPLRNTNPISENSENLQADNFILSVELRFNEYDNEFIDYDSENINNLIDSNHLNRVIDRELNSLFRNMSNETISNEQIITASEILLHGFRYLQERNNDFYDHVQIGFSDDDINKIPEIQNQQIEQIDCSICIEFVKQNEIIKDLNCKHIFHKNCLIEWLRRNKNCPNCRIEINP